MAASINVIWVGINGNAKFPNTQRNAKITE